MIKLTKLECPDVLSQNKESWTTELMSYIDRGERPPSHIVNRYNKPEIKAAIKKETHKKCVYCESYIEHVHPGDIEYIKPKSKYPHLTFEWENLTYVCRECNRRKRDEYDESCPLINPYTEDPSNFLLALHAYVYHRPGSKRGHLTEVLLELNRPPLLEARSRRIDALRILLDRYVSETTKTIKEALLTEIRTEIAEDKEYSFCLKSIFEQMTTPPALD
jgi:hypothetical protein